jgi:hypothetical protein
MAKYVFNVPLLPEELPGWQDVLSCPFCLNVAVECIRLPHAEADQDCGVCACASCVREWVTFCDNAELVCPRCRYPICAVHLHDLCSGPNARDPLIARLVSDVVAKCPYCDLGGTVSTITSHATKQCVTRHLIMLHNADIAMQHDTHSGALTTANVSRWVETVVALHAMSSSESARYLVQWVNAMPVEWHQWGVKLLGSLFIRLPLHVLDVCNAAGEKASPLFSVATITSMYKMLFEQIVTLETDCYSAVCNQLINRIAEFLKSDEPHILRDLAVHLRSVVKAIPHELLRSFGERLLTMDPAPTILHAELLVCLIEEDILCDEELVVWVLPILRLPNVDRWWRPELVAHCMFRGMSEWSPFYPMMDALVGLWLTQFDLKKQRSTTNPLHWIAASLVSGVYPFTDLCEVPDVFVVLSMSSAPILERMDGMSHSIWTSFLNDVMKRQRVDHFAEPLVLTPRVAYLLGHFAMETQTPPFDPLNEHEAYIKLLVNIGALLTNPSKLIVKHNALTCNGSIPWTMSWLGYFTLSVKLLGTCTENFEYCLISDDKVVCILTAAVHNPTWLEDPNIHAGTVDWNWARTVVHLVSLLSRSGSRSICKVAVARVAQYMGGAMKVVNVAPQKRVTLCAPIFPRPNDFRKFLWLLDDGVLLQPRILPIFVSSNSSVVLNRMRTISPQMWTANSVTQLVEFGSAKTVAAVAWAAWFSVGMDRDAQRAAILAADRTHCSRPRTKARWVIMLRIQAQIPRLHKLGRYTNTLEELLSPDARMVDVEWMLNEWVVNPSAQVRAEVNRWATSARGHPLANTPALFVLAQLRGMYEHMIPVPDHPPGSLNNTGISGMVGQFLVEQASSENLRNARDAFRFVVHYAVNDVLVAVARCWANNLRNRLVDLCWIASEYTKSFNTNWYLEERCASFSPRIEVVDCLCLGLHMVMPSYDLRIDCLFLVNNDRTMKQLVALLGGGDTCHFLFVHTTRLRKWIAWAALVCCESAAWRQFVLTSADGHAVAASVFEQFPELPPRNPERRAWILTRNAVPWFSLEGH